MVKPPAESDDIEIIYINLDEEEVSHEEASDSFQKKTSIPVPQEKSILSLRTLLSYAAIVVIAYLCALFITHVVILNAHVPSSSMEPGIMTGDKLIGYRLAYLVNKPEQGDIVIFDHQCYKGKETETLIKRVMGVAGDTIEVRNGILYRNGKKLSEPYIKETMTGDYGPVKVPKGCIFAMGDNRNVSDDSRRWDYPFVSTKEIIAKAVLRYMPSLKVIK